ncbi:MAG: DEAD/DEAH box helicase [Anaerolineae bacterium]
MNPTSFISHLKKQDFYHGQMMHVERLPARRARSGRLKQPLPQQLVATLKANRIPYLFLHQAQAINVIREGYHAVISTGTASGKSLCYNLPVLEAVTGDHRARALYLFPTKALAHDQLRALKALIRPLKPRPRFGAYDGDTPPSSRSRLRREAAILLTNPDMLHVGILPNHSLWTSFLQQLRFVIIDEAHVYRGVFGSQVAMVLRRLTRLCRFYGSAPQFICCSATIANPGEHVERLTGAEPVVINDNGAPRAPKQFVLWNPPFLDKTNSARRSPNSEAASLFTELVRHNLRNITFTKARVVAELILRYARDALGRTDPDLKSRVASYRAGYLADQRRQIEQGLLRGDLIGVTATTALELGVDVGDLDATVSVGYPGTVASLWQQAGRAGRRRGASLAMLIGQDNPLDQYFMRHPRQLFDRSHEHALIDPGNIYILEQHLPCAAYELPLRPDDETCFGESFIPAMVALEKKGLLAYEPDQDRWVYRGKNYPAAQMGSLRSGVGSRPVALRDASQKFRSLEEMDSFSAPSRVHPGAVYLHQGESYLVRKLDLEKGEAILTPARVDYYTQPREISDIAIIRSYRHKPFKNTTAYWGTVRVTQQVVSFRRVQQFSEAQLGEEFLDLPPNTFETRALWWDVPPDWAPALARRGWDYLGGLHAVEHAAIGLLPLFAMCDRWDIGGLSTPAHPDTNLPQIFIYDGHPGGVGISEQGFALLAELWRATLSAIKDCPCQEGCPSCIYSPKCGNNNSPLDKRAAIWILQKLLG